MIFVIYSEVMETDIIKRAKLKDHDALTQIIKDNEKMVYSIIQKLNLEFGDYLISKEDLFQEGLIAICQAVKDFDVDKGVRFSTFAHGVIYRRLLRVYKRQARIYYEERYSYSKLPDPDHYYSLKTDYVSDNPIAYYENNYYKEILESMSGEMDELDRNIIGLKLKCYTYEEIGKELSISAKLVDYRIRRLKKKFRDRKDQYL